LHLSESFVDLLEALAYQTERLTETRFESGLQFFIDGEPHLFETCGVVGLDSSEALIERGADRFELGALAALCVRELLQDGGSQRFRALIGLHGVALETGGEFFPKRAGVFGLAMAQAGEVVTRIDWARAQKKGDEQNYYNGEEYEGEDGKHFRTAMFLRIHPVSRYDGGHKMRLRRTVFPLGVCALCLAQTPPPHAFDVASVKPEKFAGAATVGVKIEGNTFHAEYMGLNQLIEYAYNIEEFQLSGGPAWAADRTILSPDLFQIIAKAAPGETPSAEQFRVMLQTLLADRFHLQIHHIDRQLPAYNLVVDRGGAAFKETAGGKTAMKQRAVGEVGWSIDATNVTIPRAISLLSYYAHRLIFDKTGLTGNYDFTVKWLLNQLGAADVAGSDLPSLPNALQEQLGLRLESITAPYDTIVIDHAEKPSEN
jgi:uncharacterized protein (TIGR03435 family)